MYNIRCVYKVNTFLIERLHDKVRLVQVLYSHTFTLLSSLFSSYSLTLYSFFLSLPSFPSLTVNVCMSLFNPSADDEVCNFFLCFSEATRLVICSLSNRGEAINMTYGISPEEPITLRAYNNDTS